MTSLLIILFLNQKCSEVLASCTRKCSMNRYFASSHVKWKKKKDNANYKCVRTAGGFYIDNDNQYFKYPKKTLENWINLNSSNRFKMIRKNKYDEKQKFDYFPSLSKNTIRVLRFTKDSKCNITLRHGIIRIPIPANTPLFLEGHLPIQKPKFDAQLIYEDVWEKK